jgi:uncharacterized protein YcbK (DUF882 family)
MQITAHFKRSEFDCKDGTIVPEKFMTNLKLLCKNLEVIRLYFHRFIIINSGFRSSQHNKDVGGSSKSYHLTAQACDFRIKDISPSEIATVMEMLIFEEKLMEGGIGIYKSHIHYDVSGIKRRWNMI